MYYITLFLESLYLTGFVTVFDGKNTKLLAKQIKDLSQADDITSILQTIIDEFRSYHNSTLPILRIVFADHNLIQHRILPLPNIHLKAYEIDTYVVNSLAKAFRSQEPLGYDYQHQLKGENEQLIVYAYPEQTLKKWLNQYSAYRVNFIGITQSLIEYSVCQKESHDLFYSLAGMQNLAGFNLLPWRKQIKQRKRVIFLSIAILSLLLSLLALYWLVNQKEMLLDQQTLKYQQLHIAVMQKKIHLSKLEELNDMLRLEQASFYQKIINQKQLQGVVTSLAFIANQVPDGLWLSSLSYNNNQILLTGESFEYVEILAFSQSLNEQILLSNKITSINQFNQLLQFKIDVQLQNMEHHDEP